MHENMKIRLGNL